MSDRMTRRRTVLATLVLGALVLAASAGTWVTGTAQSGLGGPQALTIAGTDAAPGVAAAALALLAAGIAAGLVGRAGRWVVVAVVAVASVVVSASAIGVLADPAAPARSAAAAATGVATLDGSPQPGVLVVLALVLGVVGVVLAVLVALAGGGWARDRRHERGSSVPTTPEADDPAELWDRLTRGDDAT